jgi:hypothetical protein
MVASPAVLVVAHPGHELRLHHWLESARPRVFVITDGSGSGRARIASTLETLAATGCAAGAIMGAFTDREIYRLILNGDVDPIVSMTVDLADELIEHDVGSVVADSFEFYNPTHDLCSVVASLAKKAAQLATGRTIARYAYAVTEAPSGDGETLLLDDAALARKIAAADRCESLKAEVESLLARIGVDALRREVLTPAGAETPKPATKPFYETHGENRVAAGHYMTVIRYEQHFRPFVEKLAAAVQATGVAHHAARS